MSINEALAGFAADDYTVKLLKSIFKVLPYSPEYTHYSSLDDAIRALKPGASAADVQAVYAAAEGEDIGRVLWMANKMDQLDGIYMGYTGVRSAVSFFFGDRAKALETDQQQRNDAVLKALGMAYMIYRAFPGSMTEKAEAFRSTPAGQAMSMYYASVEVALPFADNALVKGGNILEDLFNKEGAAQFSKLSSLAGDQSMHDAQGMLATIAAPLRQIVDHASNYVKPVAETAQAHLPAVMSGVDKAAGAVATAADMMPVYRLLGARLAAEAAVRRALGA